MEPCKAKGSRLFTSDKRRQLRHLHPVGAIKDMISAGMHRRDWISARKETSILRFTGRILS